MLIQSLCQNSVLAYVLVGEEQTIPDGYVTADFFKTDRIEKEKLWYPGHS